MTRFALSRNALGGAMPFFRGFEVPGGAVFSGSFWRATIIRAVRTLAQTAVAAIGTTAAIEQVDWAVVGSAAGMAAVLSVLTAVATGLPEAPSAKPDPES